MFTSDSEALSFVYHVHPKKGFPLLSGGAAPPIPVVFHFSGGTIPPIPVVFHFSGGATPPISRFLIVSGGEKEPEKRKNANYNCQKYSQIPIQLRKCPPDFLRKSFSGGAAPPESDILFDLVEQQVRQASDVPCKDSRRDKRQSHHAKMSAGTDSEGTVRCGPEPW